MSILKQLFETAGPLAVFVIVVPIIFILTIFRMVAPFWIILLGFGVLVLIAIIILTALKNKAGKIEGGAFGQVP